jgi:hypothetical protein
LGQHRVQDLPRRSVEPEEENALSGLGRVQSIGLRTERDGFGHSDRLRGEDSADAGPDDEQGEDRRDRSPESIPAAKPVGDEKGQPGDPQDDAERDGGPDEIPRARVDALSVEGNRL